jgi:hypothetical protein
MVLTLCFSDSCVNYHRVKIVTFSNRGSKKSLYSNVGLFYIFYFWARSLYGSLGREAKQKPDTLLSGFCYLNYLL